MARNPSALIWITHKASKVQKKHKNMKWKTAIKEAASQYHKKHGTKKIVKKIWKKKKTHINIYTCKICKIFNQTNQTNDKQCSICSYEAPILGFGLHQEMA